MSTLAERGYRDLAESVVARRVVTPADWLAAGMSAGTPFAAAHTFGQTGPFRPANVAPTVDGAYFVGSGTVPGVGVPMVLVSGRLVAERVLGARPRQRGRS